MHTIRELAAKSATGELACALEDAEVHVYLQAGRIAWATSSAARFAFAKDLAERCNLDRETFRELISVCRKESRRLGETLVTWQLASEAQVRDSLRLQIRDALSELTGDPKATSIFLPRDGAYRHYDSTFTFDAEELLTEIEIRAAPGPRVTRRSSFPAMSKRGGEEPDLHRRLAEWLVVEPSARWLECWEKGERTVRYASTGIVGGADARLISLLGELEPRRLLIRGASETVLAISRPGQSVVLLAIDADAPVGTALVAAVELGVARPTSSGGCSSRVELTLEFDGDACAFCHGHLKTALTSSSELLRIEITTRTGRRVRADRRGADERARLEELHESLASLLDGRSALTLPPTQELATDFPTSVGVATEADLAFGRKLVDGTGRTLWLAVARDTHEGLGWALLEALGRALEEGRCECEEAQRARA